jgi:hypothetical protein
MNNVFTVICLYPEYATEDLPSDTLIRTVEARNAFEASRLVQRIATREAYVAIKQPSDFQVIAVFPGHVRPELEARNFRTPA